MNGKGGTGKTTVSALLIKHLVASKKSSILAIDADPNSNLPEIIDVKCPATIVGLVEEISKHMDKIPAGVAKERFIEMRIQDALAEEDDLDLLVMGRPEGPGCYCYINNLLRDMTAKITKNYDYVIIDNAAGMEHISRRTTRSIDKLVLVSDHSIFGIRSAKRIYDLARELQIKIKDAFLIVNKVTGSLASCQSEIDDTGLELAGTIPYEPELQRLGVSANTIFEFEGKALQEAVEKIFNKIMRG